MHTRNPLALERGGMIETEETERAKAVLSLRVPLRWCTDEERVRGWRQELDGARRGVAVAAEVAGSAGGKGGKGACQLCPRRATSRVKPGFSSSLLSETDPRDVHERLSWRRVRERRTLGNTDFRYPPTLASRRRRCPVSSRRARLAGTVTTIDDNRRALVHPAPLPACPPVTSVKAIDRHRSVIARDHPDGFRFFSSTCSKKCCGKHRPRTIPRDRASAVSKRSSFSVCPRSLSRLSRLGSICHSVIFKLAEDSDNSRSKRKSHHGY